ncbi:MAG: hypothetical protein GW760_03430 [Legionella sp.]|nr:hypothetical protein [Legionella sp.]
MGIEKFLARVMTAKKRCNLKTICILFDLVKLSCIIKALNSLSLTRENIMPPEQAKKFNLFEPNPVNMPVLPSLGDKKNRIDMNPLSVFSSKSTSYSDKLHDVFISVSGIVDPGKRTDEKKRIGLFDMLTGGVPRTIRSTGSAIIATLVDEEDYDEDENETTESCLDNFRASDIPGHLIATTVVIAAAVTVVGADLIPRFVLAASCTLLAAPVVAAKHYYDTNSHTEDDKKLSPSV